MLSIFVFLFISFLGVVLLSSSHPVVLGGFLLISCLLFVILISMKISVLLGVVLFLVFIGGLLVVFSYSVALSPNPFFSKIFGSNQLLKVFFFFSLLSLMYFYMFYLMDLSLSSFWSVVSMNFQWNKMITFSSLWGKLIVFMGLMLFFCMVGVVNICSFYKGALVQFN